MVPVRYLSSLPPLSLPLFFVRINCLSSLALAVALHPSFVSPCPPPPPLVASGDLAMPPPPPPSPNLISSVAAVSPSAVAYRQATVSLASLYNRGSWDPDRARDRNHTNQHRIWG